LKAVDRPGWISGSNDDPLHQLFKEKDGDGTFTSARYVSVEVSFRPSPAFPHDEKSPRSSRSIVTLRGRQLKKRPQIVLLASQE
jgi:hypothetical protein